LERARSQGADLHFVARRSIDRGEKCRPAVTTPSSAPPAEATVAEELRRAVPAGATCSIGVAMWDGRETPDALVARADAALYRAKAAGRDRVVAALAA
jgi:GGDEF domain-containing protein